MHLFGANIGVLGFFYENGPKWRFFAPKVHIPKSEVVLYKEVERGVGRDFFVDSFME